MLKLLSFIALGLGLTHPAHAESLTCYTQVSHKLSIAVDMDMTSVADDTFTGSIQYDDVNVCSGDGKICTQAYAPRIPVTFRSPVTRHESETVRLRVSHSKEDTDAYDLKVLSRRAKRFYKRAKYDYSTETLTLTIRHRGKHYTLPCVVNTIPR